MPPSSDENEFRAVLHRSKNIVALAGAGLSAASGIAPWRSSQGLWATYDPKTLATPQAFVTNPSLVWRHYHMLRQSALEATPNAAHLALAVLGIPDLLHAVAPNARFTLVTQNIDGLDRRALELTRQQYLSQEPSITDHESEDAPAIYEMHGRVLDTLCTSCGSRKNNRAMMLCPALGDSKINDPGSETEIPVEDLPHCAESGCNGLLRPGVVWFDEIPHNMRKIWEVIDAADLCLVVGTSFTVYPANAFAHEVSDHGGKVAIFNTERNEDDDKADFLFLGPCEETLPRVLLAS